MRHYPALVYGIAVKSTGQLVVHAAVRHALQRGDKHVPQVLVAGSYILIDEKIQHAGMRKLRRLPEPSVAGVEHAQG